VRKPADNRPADALSSGGHPINRRAAARVKALVRDLALILGMLFYLPMALRAPAAGVLCWVWFSIMNPHRQVYGFTYGQPLNSVVAVATIIGWLASREPKRWPADATPWLLLALLGWMTLDTPFAAAPGFSWIFWDRTVRFFAMIFMVYFLFTTKARIHGMIWVLLISLGFYGVKGGVFTILKGGHAIVYGPPDSVFFDNNQLALAVVTELPLVYYVIQHTKSAWLRLPAAAAMMLQVVMVFGSYSRGGVLALGVMMSILWLRSDRKVLYALLAVVVVAGGLSVMPDSFFQRLDTVNNLNSDESFQGRVVAWHVAFLYATEHFPFGAGFNGPQLPMVFNHYFPDDAVHAAQSIYFQILGDHGWIGLGLWLPILLLALRNAGIVRRQTRGNPELIWAYDLADMMRVSLISFYFGGAALSMAYSDVYLVLIALLANLRVLTQPATIAAQARAQARDIALRPMPQFQPGAAAGRAMLPYEPRP
jgi:probable O-glycosylation ligase (exosortase A-associated)